MTFKCGLCDTGMGPEDPIYLAAITFRKQSLIVTHSLPSRPLGKVIAQ